MTPEELANIVSLQNTARIEIDSYFDTKESIFQALETGAQFAVDAFTGQFVYKDNQALQELLRSLNHDKGAGGFILELLIIGLTGPVVGSMVTWFEERLLFRAIVEARKKDLTLLTELYENTRTRSYFFHTGRDLAPSTLTPEISKEAAKILRHSFEGNSRKLGEELVYTIESLKRQINVGQKELIEFWSPLGSNVVKDSYQLFMGKTLTEEKQKSDFETLYDNTPDNIFLTISNIETSASHYAGMQKLFDKAFRKMYLLENAAIFDVDVINSTIVKFKNWNNVLEEIVPNTEDLKLNYAKYFEAIFWILYLGHPSKWHEDFYLDDFEEIPEEDLGLYGYKIKELDGSLKKDVHKVSLGPDSKIIVTSFRQLRRYESGMGPVYRPRIKINFPMVLLRYLVKRYGKTPKESFMAEARRKRAAHMNNKPGGFGVDGPEPLTAEELDPNKDRLKEIRHSLEVFEISPYVDPLFEASMELADWFSTLYEQLVGDGSIVHYLKGKFKGDLVMKFQFPS